MSAHVSLEEVRERLDQWGISYQQNTSTSSNASYEVASLFAPVPHGFYFFVGEDVPPVISDSVVLCPLGTRPSPSNVLIRVDDDPQRVFYRLLAALFPQTSSGVVAPSAVIHPDARLGENVEIGAFCTIGRCEIGDGTIVGAGCYLHDQTVVGANTVIEPQSVIGARGMAWVWDEAGTGRHIQPQLGGVTIGSDCILGANTIVVRGSLNEHTVIGDGVLIAPGARLGHGTNIAPHCHLANSIVTGGNVRLGEGCFVGSAAVFRPKVRIHPSTIVGSGSVVVRNTTGPGLTLMGIPAREHPTKQQPAGMPAPRRSE